MLVETSTAAVNSQTISWLLQQENPGVRYWTMKDLLGKPFDDPELRLAQEHVASWKPVAELLSQQKPEGYWEEPEDVYWPKWTATTWQLILLGELGLSQDHESIKQGCEYYLTMMHGQDRSWPPRDYSRNDFQGQLPAWRSVWEPCVLGNMARTFVLFGYEDDPRVREMFEWLVKYPLPDGGWNCESGEWNKDVFHSSFMSTIEPLWAFAELNPQKWPKDARDVVENAVEFMLLHHLYRSDKTGKIINEEWTKLHFPLFYFYDILHGLRILTKLGYEGDERLNDAFELLKSKRLLNGTWPMEASFLHSLGRNLVKDSVQGWTVLPKDPNNARIPTIYNHLGQVEQPNPWITLNALRVLKEQDE
jgi:hypothetical protein